MIVYRAWWKFWPVVCWRHRCWVKRTHCCWGCLWEKDQEVLNRKRKVTLVGGPADGTETELPIYSNELVVPKLRASSFVRAAWQPEGGSLVEPGLQFEQLRYRREDRFVYMEKDDE